MNDLLGHSITYRIAVGPQAGRKAFIEDPTVVNRILKHQYIGVPEPDTLARLVDEGGIETLTGPVGSVIFFECNVMHGSNSNITPYPRSNVFMVFNSVENTLAEPFAAPQRRPEWIANHSD